METHSIKKKKKIERKELGIFEINPNDENMFEEENEARVIDEADRSLSCTIWNVLSLFKQG